MNITNNKSTPLKALYLKVFLVLIVLALILSSCGDKKVSVQATASIAFPTENTRFKTGEVFEFKANYDAEKLKAEQLFWKVTLIHGTHDHPDAFEFQGAEGSWAFPDHGDNTYSKLCLYTLIDSKQNEIECVQLYHEEVKYTFDTVPSGLELNYNASLRKTPFEVDTYVNSIRTISAATNQDGNTFESWSIAGNSSQNIRIAETSQTITAFYTPKVLNSTKPEITLKGLDDNQKFAIGDNLNVLAEVTDVEDGQISGERIQWSVLLSEDDLSTYEVYQQTGDSLSWTIPNHKDNSYYTICVRVTDSSDTTAKECMDLANDTVIYSFDSEPQGLQLSYENKLYQTPFQLTIIRNAQRQIFAPSLQGSYEFEQWVLGDNKTKTSQTIVLEEDDKTVVAKYKQGSKRLVEKTYVQLPAGALPVTIQWSKDGRLFIAEKHGKVRVVQEGVVLPDIFLDVSQESNHRDDRGLTGFALHPNFPDTPYVYVLYTYDPPETLNYPDDNFAGPDGAGQRTLRLVRYTADSSKNFNSVIAESAKIIAGANGNWETSGNPFVRRDLVANTPLTCTFAGQPVEDCIEQDDPTHASGSIAFLKDGSLLFGVGDATFPYRAYPLALRSIDLNSFAGKVLRVDAETGKGLPDNPFYNGNPNSTQSKVYNLGLRNPFRFTLHPATDELFISDVGWMEWEEINRGKGQNFGWPCYEGAQDRLRQTPSYDEYQTCKDLNSLYETDKSVVTAPIHAWHHPDERDEDGAGIIGPFYTGDSYPGRYKEALFFGDYVKRTLWAMFLEEEQTRIEFFADLSFPLTDIKQGPDGDLYMTDIIGGRVVQLSYEDTQ